MGDPTKLPPITVDNTIDDEGGDFLEETLNIGSTPSQAKSSIPGDDDLSSLSLTNPLNLGEGYSFEVSTIGPIISKTIYDNRQRAKSIIFSASFNEENSDHFMSMLDGANYPDGQFQNLTYNEILTFISQKSNAIAGAEFIYNGDNPKLDVYAGEFKFENVDIVSAFTQVLERAGNFSWWLKRNSGRPGVGMFTKNVEILDLGDPDANEVATLGTNIVTADFTGPDSAIGGVIVTDKDGHGSKMQFGVPQDAGRNARPSKTYSTPAPLEGGPINANNVPPDFDFSKYNIDQKDYGVGDTTGFKQPLDQSGNAVLEDMELSFNYPSDIGGTFPVFNVPSITQWPNAEPPIGTADLSSGQAAFGFDYVKIERKMITHPNVEMAIEVYYSPLPSILRIRIFNEVTVTDPNTGTQTVISPTVQYEAWKNSSDVSVITNAINAGKHPKFDSYEFLVNDYKNNSGRDAKRVGLVGKARKIWTSIPEMRVDFERAFVYIPNKYFYLMGNWADVAQASFVTDPSISPGASATTPKIVYAANFGEALAQSKIRFIGALSRPHKVGKAGSAPYSTIRKGDFESTNVIFNAAGVKGFRKFDAPFDDLSDMQAIADALYSQNINKSGSRGKITIYPGNQDVKVGQMTNGGVIVRVHHSYVPYFKTEINLAGDSAYYDLDELNKKRELNDTKIAASITDASLRQSLGGVGGGTTNSGPAALVAPHTHNDQFSGGNSLGHIIVKSITIDADTNRDSGKQGPALELTAFGDQGTLDIQFDPDKGKFVTQTSLFVDKDPAVKRNSSVTENESTQFTDINQAGGSVLPGKGFTHQLIDFVYAGQSDTDKQSRVALNIAPQQFEPFNDTANADSATLRNWGGDRIYVGDSYDRPGLLSAYTSNPVLLFSRYSSTSNSKNFFGNNTENRKPVALIGVRKPTSDQITNRFTDTLFNKPAESVAYASILMDEDHDFMPAFKLELKESDGSTATTVGSGPTGTAPTYDFPNRAGSFFGGHVDSSIDSTQNIIHLNRAIQNTGSTPTTGTTLSGSQTYAHEYLYSYRTKGQAGWGTRIDGTAAGSAEGIPTIVAQSSGENKHVAALDVYNSTATNDQNSGKIRGIVTGGNPGITFLASGLSGGSLATMDSQIFGAGITLNPQYFRIGIGVKGFIDTADYKTGTETWTPIDPSISNIGSTTNYNFANNGFLAQGIGQSRSGQQGSLTNTNFSYSISQGGISVDSGGNARLALGGDIGSTTDSYPWWNVARVAHGPVILNGTPVGPYSGSLDSLNTEIDYNNNKLIFDTYDMTGMPHQHEEIELVSVEEFNRLRDAVLQLQDRSGSFGGSASGGVTFGDMIGWLSALASIVDSKINDILDAIDNIRDQLREMKKKLKEVQDALKKIKKLITVLFALTVVFATNKKTKEGKDVTPGGTTHPGNSSGGTTGGTGGATGGGSTGGTTPGGSTRPPGSVYGGTSTPGAVVGGPTGPVTGKGGTSVGVGDGDDGGGGGHEPGGGEEGEGKDNKSAQTGLQQGIAAMTGNATPSSGSRPANSRVTGMIGPQPGNVGSLNNAPYLVPENVRYNDFLATGKMPIGIQLGPETSNPNTYLLNAPQLSISSVQNLWKIGGGGGAATGATGFTSDALAPVTQPGASGWDKTQDVRSRIQLANRAPTVELDAAGRWVIVGGGHMFPTMSTSGGLLAVSDDTTARVNLGGIEGALIGIVKDVTGMEVNPQLVVSQRAFGLISVDSASNKFISNNYGSFQATLGSDGEYEYSNATQTPIYGGLVKTLMNRVNRYDSRIGTVSTGLFTGATSPSAITPNSSLEEAITAVDLAFPRTFDDLTDVIVSHAAKNQIPYFDGTNWVNTSSVYVTGTNIGIGQATPSYQLEIADTGTAAILLDSDTDTTGSAASFIRMKYQASPAVAGYLGTTYAASTLPDGNAYTGILNQAFFLGTTGSRPVQIGAGGSVAMSLWAGHTKIGSDTGSPASVLQIKNSSDEKLLRVTAYSTQTNELLIIESSGATQYLKVSGSGDLQLNSSGASVNYFDADGTLAANSDARIPTQKAVKTYVTASVAAGVTDGDKGDIVVSSSGTVWTIDTGVVTNSQLANVATATFKGRTTAGTGAPEDLTATQATALLNAFVGDAGSGGTKGLVPAPAAGDAAAGKYLKADGTWAAIAAGVTDGDKGDIVVSSSGTVWTIDTNVVSNAKFRQSAAVSVVGNSTNATANVADITASADNQILGRRSGALTFAAVSLANEITGTLGIGNGGTGQTTQTAAFNALDPLTTKGDIIVNDGTNSVRQGVGTDDQAIAADSTQTNGIRYSSLTLAQVISLFGDGSDGALTSSSGTTSLSKDMYYSSITLSGTATVDTKGFKIFCNGTCDLTNAPANAIRSNGGNGGNSAGTGGGSVGTAPVAGTTGGGGGASAGAAGGTTTGTQAGAASSPTSANGGAAGANGAGGDGASGAGGAQRTGASAALPLSFRRLAVELIRGATIISGGVGAPGGSSGGGDGTAGGGGGGGATGAGVVALFARKINRGGSTAAGAISAKGGTGGNGGVPAGGNRGGGGGAGGGGGGWAYIVYDTLLGSSATNAIDCSGGTGGTGGNGTGTGKGGNGGTGGSGGRITIIGIDAGTIAETTGSAGTGGSAGSGATGGGGGAGNTFRANL